MEIGTLCFVPTGVSVDVLIRPSGISSSPSPVAARRGGSSAPSVHVSSMLVGAGCRCLASYPLSTPAWLQLGALHDPDSEDVGY
ncbi:hypothetical protein HGRIS_012245 [Hohenbuehelia grisea]|uniref:Uncharacterized protein n=1 Tax=Hohenbuehelia grisea TaxID=104357 RepID=A0ABR3IRQ6_9AGAR